MFTLWQNHAKLGFFRIAKYFFCSLKPTSLAWFLSWCKWELTGQNPSRVFNCSRGCIRAFHLLCYEAKHPSLELKTRTKTTTLGNMPFVMVLPGQIEQRCCQNTKFKDLVTIQWWRQLCTPDICPTQFLTFWIKFAKVLYRRFVKLEPLTMKQVIWMIGLEKCQKKKCFFVKKNCN